MEKLASDLIVQYPNRWKAAVENDNLRGWFVQKAMNAMSLTKMIDRTRLRLIFDGAARQEMESR